MEPSSTITWKKMKRCQACTEKRPCEGTRSRLSCTSPEKGLRRNQPQGHVSGDLHVSGDFEEVHICCLSAPVCGTLIW